MVKIKYLARFRDLTGEKSAEIDYEGALSGLIDGLVTRYGIEFKESLLNNKGSLRDYIKILINGEDVHQINGLKSHISNEDEMVIFQTIAGG